MGFKHNIVIVLIIIILLILQIIISILSNTNIDLLNLVLLIFVINQQSYSKLILVSLFADLNSKALLGTHMLVLLLVMIVLDFYTHYIESQFTHLQKFIIFILIYLLSSTLIMSFNYMLMSYYMNYFSLLGFIALPLVYLLVTSVI